MPDAWSRMARLVKCIEQCIQQKKSASVAMDNLASMMGPDTSLDDPAGYAWGAMYSNYVKDADRVVLANGPCVAPAPRWISHAHKNVWGPALSVAERVGTASPYTHRRCIVDVNQGEVTHVHAPPNLVNRMKQPRKGGIECGWVRLNSYPTLYPFAFGWIDGELHVYDCDNVLDDGTQVRRMLQCITGAPVVVRWSPAQHNYRTATLVPQVDAPEERDMPDKVHNGVLFTWDREAGAYMAGNGPLLHGVTVMSPTSVVDHVTEPTPNTYGTIAAMYRYFNEHRPTQNAAHMANQLYMKAIKAT